MADKRGESGGRTNKFRRTDGFGKVVCFLEDGGCFDGFAEGFAAVLLQLAKEREVALHFALDASFVQGKAVTGNECRRRREFEPVTVLRRWR